MDTTKITHISLCSGYGGIDLGLRRVLQNLCTVAYSEIEAFAIELLLARMEGGQLDSAPIWSNLKSFPWEEFSGKVDILSGGYPCQPFSAVGKRLGTDDPRHLWPYIASGIRLLRPRMCFFENVEGHISLGLREVVGELEELGYTTAWGIFSAAEVGAPHQRKRAFILAHLNGHRLEGHWSHVAEHDPQGRQGADGHAWPSRPSQPQHAWEPPRVVGNAASTRLEGGQQSATAWTATNPAPPASRSGQTEPALGGDAHGTPNRLDYAELSVSCDNRTNELLLLGNGVVPATAELAFKTLMKQIGKWEEGK